MTQRRPTCCRRGRCNKKGAAGSLAPNLKHSAIIWIEFRGKSPPSAMNYPNCVTTKNPSRTDRMKPDSHDLNDLMYFSYVVEHGGFSAAERVLGISKSRLSRRVSELETSLGVRLMQRSTRKLALTEAGQLFYQHCQAMLAEAQAAVDIVHSLRDSPRGSVRVSVPVTLAQTFLSAVMGGLLHRYPPGRAVRDVMRPVLALI